MRYRSQIEEELLILEICEGDKESFNKLVRIYNKKLIYQSFLRTNDWGHAQDIVQDVWHWLIKNQRKLNGVGNFSSWIRTIVDRRSVDWIRKQKKIQLKNQELENGNNRDAIVDSASNSFDSTENAERRALEAVIEALKLLDPNARLILNLYYMENESITSISRILDIPKGTVKSRLFTSREKLKSIIKQNSNES